MSVEEHGRIVNQGPDIQRGGDINPGLGGKQTLSPHTPQGPFVFSLSCSALSL